MTQDDMHQVHVQTDFAADGLAVWVTLKDSMGRRILRPDGRNFTWEPIVPATNVSPSFTLHDGHARALMSALLDHYHGTPDSHTQRADLMHERQRRDTLEDLLIRLLDKPRQQAITVSSGGLGGQSGSSSATANAPR